MSVGLAATDPLSDAQTQLAVVSTYLNAASAGTATSVQLQAALAALTLAQTDILNAAAAKLGPSPTGVWVDSRAAAAAAAGTAVAGGVVGWWLGRRRKKAA